MPPAIGPRTQLCGVVLHPAGHTRSPAMHNAAFAALGIDAGAQHVELEAVIGIEGGQRDVGVDARSAIECGEAVGIGVH